MLEGGLMHNCRHFAWHVRQRKMIDVVETVQGCRPERRACGLPVWAYAILPPSTDSDARYCCWRRSFPLYKRTFQTARAESIGL